MQCLQSVDVRANASTARQCAARHNDEELTETDIANPRQDRPRLRGPSAAGCALTKTATQSSDSTDLLHYAVVERLCDLVTLATAAFQLFRIENANDASMIGDDVRRLQCSGDDRYCLAANTQHLGQELMGQHEFFLSHPVTAHKQPSAHPLFH